MRSTLAALACMLGVTSDTRIYSGASAPTGRAAKSPELQQELIAAAKAKRERHARSPGRRQTKYLKGGV